MESARGRQYVASIGRERTRTRPDVLKTVTTTIAVEHFPGASQLLKEAA
jgi:hypothetical protein